MSALRHLLALRSLLWAVAASLVLYFFWAHLSETRPDNIESLFANLLSLLSIFSGFVASFYFFVASRGNGFLAKIERTRTFEDLIRLTGASLVLSFVVIVFLFFLSGYAPRASECNQWPPSVVDAFVILAFFAVGLVFANFVRCMRLFVTLTRPTK